MIQVAQILFILSVLVILHEFGHYITARMFKVRVEKFYLFMDAGFSLLKKKIGETEWGIGWLPLGGYVKLSGMIDESMDTAQMNAPAEPWEFRSKPAWQRLIIMLGGIIVNVILAWLIFTIMYATVGQKFIATEKIQENGLAFGEVGQKAGFRNGDKILSVDGKHQPSFNRMTLDVLLGDKVEVERNGQKVDVILTDEMKGEIISKEGKDFVGPRFSNTVVDSVIPKSAADMAGLKKGDKIKALNGTAFTFYDEFKDTAPAQPGPALLEPQIVNTYGLSLQLTAEQAAVCTLSISDAPKVNGHTLQWTLLKTSSNVSGAPDKHARYVLSTADGIRRNFYDIKLNSNLSCSGTPQWHIVDYQPQQNWLIDITRLPDVDTEQSVAEFMQRYRFLNAQGLALAPLVLPNQIDDFYQQPLQQVLHKQRWFVLWGRSQTIEQLSVSGEPVNKQWHSQFPALP